MELYAEILTKALESGEVRIVFPGESGSAAEIVESRSYEALKKIKGILEDETLDDCACFSKIEEIICVFEDLGSNGGSRHDFG